ncbi:MULTISPECIES: copper amine oxidase N-terminal domain-containing protein [unclassified Sedimentibacter]|uniref:copper amine oxidase N-terminal domain-containing protein n=1 Tax=unclassified Sedimentibacter TaxID=2649220 RepID=UPI0027E0C281|nr:copper amine oxidase N-terminal domain-containing protein [Sedimentibacter sp. MB35-C1]WMJ78554.1 copper amine oxidase N-terminal domain-containing protein [Sedimentibacter sp. MB35-C1]
MKKIITVFITMLLIFSFSVCYAAEIPSDIITVKINNEDIVFSQDPISENGRILVPMRTIFESLGLKVSWNEYSQNITASNGDIVITLKIGDNIANVRDINGNNTVILDNPSKLINNSTFVPIRFISDSEIEVKKMIIAHLIDRITVSTDYIIDVEFNISVEQFINYKIQ